MRNVILVGSMLNNSEAWMYLTQKNIEDLEKPDKVLKEKLFESNASKYFLFFYLEFGILPAKYVILKKRLKFLKYVLDEDIESMIRRVYEEQKNESRKGDFSYLTKSDFDELKMKITEDDIRKHTKASWNKLINQEMENVALSHLIEENKTKTKTKHIQYEKLEMQRYLSENQNTKIAKVIFTIRAGTFDIKSLNQWKYEDNLCIMCSVKEENLKPFMTCKFYKRNDMNIDDIYSNDIEKQFKIGEEAVYRKDIREIKKQEDGQASLQAPTAPGHLFC